MSKLDAKYLKKMIKEMLDNHLNEEAGGLTDKQKAAIDAMIQDLMGDEEVNEIKISNIGRNLKRGLATAGAAAALVGGLGGTAKADQAPAASWKQQLGVDDRPWQQQLGVGQRPEDGKRPEEKSYKFAVVTIKSLDNGKTIKKTFETEGRDLNRIQMDIDGYLASKYGAAKFQVVDIQGSDTDSPEEAGPSKATPAKSSKAEIKTNEDGTLTGTMSFTGDVTNAEKLVPSIVQQIVQQNPGASSSDIQYVGSRQIKMNPDGKGGTVSQTIKINKRVEVKENKVTKDYLRKLVIEHLEECGMMPAEEEGELPAEVSSIEIDPDGYEGYMAKGNLYKMSKSATELHNMLADEENLEPWVEEKIAVAARMIDDVADYMEYAKMSKKA